MNQKTIAILLIFILASGLTALTQGDSGTLATGGGYSRSQVTTGAWISASLMGTYMMSQFYFNNHSPENERTIENGMLISVHLPMYWNSICEGLVFTASFGSLAGFNRYTREEGADPFFRDFINTWPMEHALYSTYAIYRYRRLRAAPGMYNDNWRDSTFGHQLMARLDIVTNRPWKAYNFGQLLLQPFDPNNLRDPFVYILPIAGALGTLIRGMDEDKAIWNTGEAYIGRKKVKAGLAIPGMLLFLAAECGIIAATEESFFRGFLYEELGHSHGQWVAKGVDMAAFPLFHVPGETGNGYTGGEIALNFFRRSVLTFYLDSLYDSGGLGRSTAAHFWIDFSLLFMSWLMKGGVAQDGLESLMQGRDLCLQVQMPF